MSKLLDRLTDLDHVRKHENIMVQYAFRDSYLCKARIRWYWRRGRRVKEKGV